MKIAIIGRGNVGTALASGLRKANHEVKFGHRDPKEPVLDAAKWGEVIILDVLYEAVNDAARAISTAADGKVLIDVTNALDENMELTVGFATSAAEELQKQLPKVHVAKAFNTVFASNQSTGRIGKEQVTAFLAGDDQKTKQVVMQLTREMGFDPVDSGPLRSARYLEPMAVLIIGLAFKMNMGKKIRYKLVKA
jgi:predicted dinucleotide-binding enzyme